MDGGTSRTLSSRCFSGPDSGMAPSSPSVRPRPSCDKGPWMGQSIERRARCGAVWSGQVSTHAGSDEGGAAIQSSSVVLRGLPDITSTQKGKGVETYLKFEDKQYRFDEHREEGGGQTIRIFSGRHMWMVPYRNRRTHRTSEVKSIDHARPTRGVVSRSLSSFCRSARSVKMNS